MAEETLKATKTNRRTVKGTLTRCGKSLAKLIEVERPEQDIRDGLSKVQLAFDNLYVDKSGLKNIFRFFRKPRKGRLEKTVIQLQPLKQKIMVMLGQQVMAFQVYK